ncbi:MULTISPECIES: hypothetical protein [unclassified Pseudomonas]|uniref:hypothetical protein n=1 Tax=unclassified Pseudomonas TaxID=196821 RepID=UPI000C88859D|nr:MULTISPECIES: hypothetical protein [unclassified Pseudomonas]PNA02288.1 hypothetical protein C1X28_24235 [Pseudomonas sp. FW305-BF15]PNB79139.1 hypothetical protein C1X30_19985 [Pseudomonas sp. FW305-BF6]
MHSLSAYTIKVHDNLLAGPRSERYHELDNIRTRDMLDFIHSFMETLKASLHDDKDAKKTVEVIEVEKKARTVFGWLEYGEYGLAGSIVDTKTKKKTYSKKHDESDVRSLYFNFSIPAKSRTGVILLHTAGNRGIKSFFHREFNLYFKNMVGLSVQMSPLAHEKSVQEWLDKSEVKEIRLGRYALTENGADIADNLGVDRADLILKPKKGRGFPNIKGLRSSMDGGDRTYVEILSDFAADVKAVVESGGRKKVLSLKNGEPIAAIDIDEDNVEMVDGSPVPASLHKFATDLVKEFLGKVSK